jgi:hypothetical protein
MAFQGSLAELISPTSSSSSASAERRACSISSTAPEGQIYLHEGRIVPRQLDDVSGRGGGVRARHLEPGRLQVRAGAPSEIKTISKSNTNLLMEAARRLDEWRVLSKKIPSVEMIPSSWCRKTGRADQPQHQRVADPLQDRRPPQRQGDRPGQRARACSTPSKILYGLIATGSSALRDRGARARALARASAAKPRPGTFPRHAAGQARPGGRRAGASTATGADDAAHQGARRVQPRAGRVGEKRRGNKHYVKAKSELERGAGSEAIEEAINQIARATSILKGPSTTDALWSSSRPSAELSSSAPDAGGSPPSSGSSPSSPRRPRLVRRASVSWRVRAVAASALLAAPSCAWWALPSASAARARPETLAVLALALALSPAALVHPWGWCEHGRRVRRLRRLRTLAGARPRPSSPSARTTRGTLKATWPRCSPSRAAPKISPACGAGQRPAGRRLHRRHHALAAAWAAARPRWPAACTWPWARSS